MWTEHKDCKRLVSEVWRRSFYGCPMSILSQKLKALKSELKVWNKLVFGNVHQKVDQAMTELDSVQKLVSSSGPSDSLAAQELQAQTELQHFLNLQESLYKEKARLNWHSYGDRNSTYFHKIAKIRHSSKQMTMLRKDGVIHDDPADIENIVLSYFSDIYASENTCVDNNLIANSIQASVSIEDNCILTQIPSMEEVRAAVFAFNGEGAPSPDGFSAFFFQHFWDIIALDVFNSVHQFFTTGWIMPNLNSNSLVLIPKTPGADTIDNFRPIALANFHFNIITKVLADRLAIVAPKIISEHQRGFIKGRRIGECICIASEAINLLDNRSFGGKLSHQV